MESINFLQNLGDNYAIINDPFIYLEALFNITATAVYSSG
jgi:hypothetical protein